VARVLHLHRDPSFARFIADDLEILSSCHEVIDVRAEADLTTIARLGRALIGVDLIYAWWGDLTGLLGVLAAKLERRPSILITGGYDIADVPSIRYGLRYHRWKRFLPPIALRLASAIVTNSESAQREVRENYGTGRAITIPHGFDPGRYPSGGAKERSVLTVSKLSKGYIPYKGLLTFVRAARLLPDVRFVQVGQDSADGTLEILKAEASPNVEFKGFLSEPELKEEMRRATVYAQLSAHEGFGMALAEAMLSGATPVVTSAGAIPEVAGDVGRYVAYGDVEGTAAAILSALESPSPGRARARIADRFPIEKRREAILALVDQLIAK
jgi:glycosyltransferase involved in cell wall biosynthesis